MLIWRSLTSVGREKASLRGLAHLGTALDLCLFECQRLGFSLSSTASSEDGVAV